MILTYIKDIDIKGLRFPKIINCNSNKFFILGSKQELNENKCPLGILRPVGFENGEEIYEWFTASELYGFSTTMYQPQGKELTAQ